MRAVLQRVAGASVDVDGERVSAIDGGLLVLVGVADGDGEADAAYIAQKIAGVRCFADEAGKMNRSIAEAGGALLLVSQFTLLGDLRKGRRPSFDGAARPAAGKALFERVVEMLRAQGLAVSTGVFGAHMAVSLVNDGPVTLLLESKRIL